MFLNLILY